MKKNNDSVQNSEYEAGLRAGNVALDFQSHWQIGDWDWLLQELGGAATSKTVGVHEQIKVRLAAAHYQNGSLEVANDLVAEARLTGDCEQALLFTLLSGYNASIAKCYLLLGDESKALAAMGESVLFDGVQSSTAIIAPIKLSIQAEQLGLTEGKLIPSVSDQAGSSTLADLKDLYFESIKSSGIHKMLLSHLFDTVSRYSSDSKEMLFAGNKTEEQDDPFFPGKLAVSIADLISQLPLKSKVAIQFCKHFREIILPYLEWPVQSWGIYFFLSALHKLQELDLLEEIFSYKELNKLRQNLHWREFVDPGSFELVNKPNNFYQVAYAISLFRFLLGWDDGDAKDIFLQKMLEHVEPSAALNGFADETEGKGRYDRYSVLLIAEIAHRFRESGLPLTKPMKVWLKQSADFMLMHANSEGTGFQYGRSIGPYGDSSINEILSAAAWFGLLDGKEKEIAYIYCQLSTNRFLDFWWDEKEGRVNLWFDGRATDKYRDRSRILGETLSLLHHHIYTTEVWQGLGVQTSGLKSQPEKEWLSSLPTTKFYRLNIGENEYGIFIYRRKGNAFTLPLINGEQFHDKSFYLPIPYNTSCIQGVPGESFNVLVPKLSASDGRKLMPLSWFKKIEYSERDDLSIVKYKQYKFDVLNETKPVSNKSFRSETQYTFSKDYIERKDSISWTETQDISIGIEFLSFYPVSSIEGEDVFFSDGPIEKIRLQGYEELSAKRLGGDEVICSNEKKYVDHIFAMRLMNGENKVNISWTVFFRG